MNDENYLKFREPNAIELLGYAKNSIVEAMEQFSDFKQEHLQSLNEAYSLLDGVQNYLFNENIQEEK